MKQNQTQIKLFRKNYNDSDSGKVFLICLLAPFVLSFLFSTIASTIADSYGMKTVQVTSSLGYLIPYCLCIFILYIGIYFIYNKTCKIEFCAIRPKFKMKWHTYLIIVLVGIISLFGLQYFINVFDNFLNILGYPLETGLSTINPTNWGLYLLSILLLAVVPAIGEELLFRGMILQGLRSRFKDVSAVLLSSVMFALMHGSLQQLVYPFLLGVVMGWIVLRTGSLISSIIVHFINNFLVVTFSFIQNTTGFSLSLGNNWLLYVVAIVLFVVTATICYLIDRFYFKHKNTEEVEKLSTKTSMFIYISIGVAVALFILTTLIVWLGNK